MSVRDFLTRVRVAIAQDLVAHTDEKLEAIATRLGFATRRTCPRVPADYRTAAERVSPITTLTPLPAAPDRARAAGTPHSET
jgi:hypothetical protein